jgi:DNA-binding transcriptional MerR regulator
MQHFSIRQVEQLSGIKAHTIRIWEKRYKLIVPERSDGKQRTYSNENLKSILRVVYLYKKGLKISKIARLQDDEIIHTIDQVFDAATNARHVMPILMAACIDLDEDRLEEIFDELQSAMDFETLMTTIIYPFLQSIGKAWVTSRVHPNNEHFVSHLVVRRIVSATAELNSTHDSKTLVILFQPEGELHEIPLLFINYLLLKKGCSTVYFGSNIPVNELEYYCSHKPATHILFHVITHLGETEPQLYFDRLSNIFPDKKVVMSGPATGSLVANNPNMEVLKSQEALFDYINRLEC